jgi:hypothetical protein
LRGARRECLWLGVATMLPVSLWRLYVGMVLRPDWGLEAFTYHPPDLGVPLRGILDLWGVVERGEYYSGSVDMARSAIWFPLLLLAGFALSVILALRRRDAWSLAAVLHACIALSLNYQAIWVHVGNAQRGTFELFVVLALISVERHDPTLRRLLVAFWIAAGLYLCVGTFDASQVRAAFTLR